MRRTRLGQDDAAMRPCARSATRIDAIPLLHFISQLWEASDRKIETHNPPIWTDCVMAWVIVVIAGLVETGIAVALKDSHGCSRATWSIAFVALAVVSFGLLSLCLR